MNLEYDETPFVAILREAFANHSNLPERCAINLAYEVNQEDFSDVVEIVSRCGAREGLVARLRTTHPVGPNHLGQYDRHFWTVWTEACAFAWAKNVAGFDRPRFTDDRGKPDLLVGSSMWLEAKTVERSPDERRALDQMAEASDRGRPQYRMTYGFSVPHPTIVKKFNDGLSDALTKLARQGFGEIIVYFELDGIDWGTDEHAALKAIDEWSATESSNTGARIVVTRGGRWREPLIDHIPPAI
ncbi:MAG: hypothetical protein HOC77_14190 [Chloroflexi bacterium]|jgi:hypothetical protein|nr:hypothetical protein [Chloroflexota bacterium]MBT4073371.1 hypothetical protein [Chloroflexota bacterium]MBT4516227.1 hypothetical protein [Chloroflexota bacterium]